jgi:hypothetical protein
VGVNEQWKKKDGRGYNPLATPIHYAARYERKEKWEGGRNDRIDRRKWKYSPLAAHIHYATSKV